MLILFRSTFIVGVLALLATMASQCINVSAAPQLRPYLHVFDAETSSDDIVATAELPSTVEIQPFETPAVSPPAASAITSPLDTGGQQDVAQTNNAFVSSPGLVVALFIGSATAIFQAL